MSKAERTREFIIEKTAPIFNTKGYSGTSMNDITLATGLTKGAIYGNFENKDEVAIEAFKFNVKKLDNTFNSEIEKQKTFKDKLLVYPRLYSNYFDLKITKGGCPVLNTVAEADDTHPVLKKIVERVLLSWKNRLVEFIEQGILAGEFKAETIDAQRTALTIIAMIEGAIMITNATGETRSIAMVMLSVTKIIEDLQ